VFSHCIARLTFPFKVAKTTPVNITQPPTMLKGVNRSPKNSTENKTPTIGVRYIETVVLTTPKTRHAELQKTKQSADAKIPRIIILPHTDGFENRAVLTSASIVTLINPSKTECPCSVIPYTTTGNIKTTA